MKTFIIQHTLFLAVFLIFASSTVLAQQSDFEIQQEFRNELTELMESIEAAETADELSELEAEIDDFQRRYSEHSTIINSAIYPDTFERSVSRISEYHSAEIERLRLLEELNERLDELGAEMDAYRVRLSDMDAEAASLQEQIARAEESETRQAALIRQYRQNIEQRDSFVSDFLEELLARYQTMDAATQEEITEASERLEDNPLAVIQAIIAEYINVADQATGLQVPDYIAMRAQHSYFKDVWDRIGERLAATFNPDSPVQAQEEIQDLLAAWLASVDNKLWDTLTTAFNQNGIQLATFTSPATFNTSLNNYVDAGYEISLESNNEEDYINYRNFRDFWNNTVKASWGETLVNGNILSQSDIAAIDIKLNDWGEAARPTSNLMFILFLVSIAVIIGLIVLLIVRKN